MPKPLGDGCALWGTELTPDRGAQTGPHGEAQTALRVPARGTNVWKSASGVQERLVRWRRNWIECRWDNGWSENRRGGSYPLIVMRLFTRDSRYPGVPVQWLCVLCHSPWLAEPSIIRLPAERPLVSENLARGQMGSWLARAGRTSVSKGDPADDFFSLQFFACTGTSHEGAGYCQKMERWNAPAGAEVPRCL